MDSKIVIFAVLSLAVIFALVTPIETAVAQDTESNSDDKYKEEAHHDGKSCPSKEKKPTNTSGNI